MSATAAKTIVTIHKPEHRRRSLAIERNTADAIDAYDHNVGAYFDFLGVQAGKQGFELRFDAAGGTIPFTIDETDHEQKKSAHAWMESQPNIWDWIP